MKSRIALIASDLIPRVVASLDERIGDDPSSPYSARKVDTIPSPDPTPEDYYIRSLQRRRIEAALARLNPIEREIIRLRVMEGWTLQKIGRKFGYSRERIRQLEARAIAKAQAREPVARKGGTDYKKVQQAQEAKSHGSSPDLGHACSGYSDPWPAVLGGAADWWDDGSGSGDGQGEEGVG